MLVELLGIPTAEEKEESCQKTIKGRTKPTLCSNGSIMVTIKNREV